MGFGASARELLHRARVDLLANLGLKLVAIVIAVILYALVHRPVEPEPDPCARPALPGP